MRTDRRTPRLIAITILLLWGIVFYYGTAELNRRELVRQASRTDLIPVGTQAWGFYTSGSTVCAGFTKLTLEEVKIDQVTLQELYGLKASFSTEFRLALPTAQVALFQLNADAAFGEYNILKTVAFSGRIGGLTFNGESSTSDPKQIKISVSSKSTNHSFTVTRPEAILIKQGEAKYALHLPQLVEGSSAKKGLDLSLFSQLAGSSISQLSPMSAESCRAEVAELSSKHPGIDLTPLLTLLQIKPGSKMIQEVSDDAPHD